MKRDAIHHRTAWSWPAAIPLSPSTVCFLLFLLTRWLLRSRTGWHDLYHAFRRGRCLLRTQLLRDEFYSELILFWITLNGRGSRDERVMHDRFRNGIFRWNICRKRFAFEVILLFVLKLYKNAQYVWRLKIQEIIKEIFEAKIKSKTIPSLWTT